MSEEKQPYGNESQAATISPPRTIMALSDGGLIEYNVWGWVKISANFIKHIKKLKGAKLSIWQTMALSIDENGECSLSSNELAELTGYSRSEVIESQKELDGMGYLTVTKKSGKRNIYKPEFAARGYNSPTEEPVQKNDQSRKTTSPVPSLESASDQSSLSEEKSDPSIKRVKRVNTTYQPKGIETAMWQGRPVTEEDLPEFENREKPAIDAFEQALNIPANWNWYPAKTTDEKVWRDFRAYLVGLYEADNQCFVKYAQWRRKPYAKGAVSITTIKRDPSIFASSWAEYLASETMYGDEEKTRLL